MIPSHLLVKLLWPHMQHPAYDTIPARERIACKAASLGQFLNDKHTLSYWTVYFPPSSRCYQYFLNPAWQACFVNNPPVLPEQRLPNSFLIFLLPVRRGNHSFQEKLTQREPDSTLGSRVRTQEVRKHRHSSWLHGIKLCLCFCLFTVSGCSRKKLSRPYLWNSQSSTNHYSNSNVREQNGN